MKQPINNPGIATILDWLGAGSVNIFGLPFSGKDTQSHRLAEHLDAGVIAGGDILRNHEDKERIKKLMSSGKLFPSDFYLEMVLPYMSRPEFANKPLVLTSVGRWHGEEESVMKAAAMSDHDLKAVVLLGMDETEVWRRFEASTDKNDRGQRHDDAAHILEVRLQEFSDKTLPVVDFYRNLGMLIEVDAAGDVNHVTHNITHSLARLAISQSG